MNSDQCWNLKKIEEKASLYALQQKIIAALYSSDIQEPYMMQNPTTVVISSLK